MKSIEAVLFILSLCLKVFTIYFAAVAVFALRRWKRRTRVRPPTRFAVLAAAMALGSFSGLDRLMVMSRSPYSVSAIHFISFAIL